MAAGLPFRALGLTFSILGLVQGVIWTCLSVVGLLINREVLLDDCLKDETHCYILTYIRDLRKPQMLTYFILYGILSVYWIIISAEQLMRFDKGKLARLKGLLYQWCAVAAAVSIVDLAVVAVVTMDYNDLQQFSILEDLQKALMVILAIAARGAVLWIANVAGVFICFRLAKQVQAEEIKQSRYNESVQAIQAFDHLGTSPPLWMSDGTPEVFKGGHTNPNFVGDDDNRYGQTNQSAYSRQASYDPNAIDDFIDENFSGINQDYERQSRATANDDEDFWNRDVAYNENNNNNWNRNYGNAPEPKRKPKPIKILDMELVPDEELEPPIVPPPDYTPPNTPLVRAKTVLKSKPIY